MDIKRDYKKEYQQMKDTDLEWAAENINDIRQQPCQDDIDEDYEDLNEDLDHLSALIRAFRDTKDMALPDNVDHYVKTHQLAKAEHILENAESGDAQILSGRY